MRTFVAWAPLLAFCVTLLSGCLVSGEDGAQGEKLLDPQPPAQCDNLDFQNPGPTNWGGSAWGASIIHCIKDSAQQNPQDPSLQLHAEIYDECLAKTKTTLVRCPTGDWVMSTTYGDVTQDNTDIVGPFAICVRDLVAKRCQVAKEDDPFNHDTARSQECVQGMRDNVTTCATKLGLQPPNATGYGD